MARAALLFVVLLGGCAPGARNIALADLDLRDMQTVQSIRSQLGREDGQAFASYIVRHHVKSANFCGRPLVTSDGKAPETVGEAIDLAVRRDAMELQAQLAVWAPKHPRELARETWDDLVRARDIRIDAQTRLRMQYGDGAARRPEWAPLASSLAEIDRKLVAMKPAIFASGS